MKLAKLFGKAPKEAGDQPKQASGGFDLAGIIEDFKTLDPRDPSLWPTAPRLTILFLLLAGLVAAGWWFGWMVQWEDLERRRAEELTLRTSWLDKKKQAVNLDAYRAQLTEIDASFGVLLEQLPNASEIGSLLVDVNKAAQANGLSIELFRPAGEIRKEFYAEIPIAVEFTGSYHDLGAFAGDLSQMARVVTLNNIDMSLKGNVKGSEPISFKATAKTFRYLDEAELAAQKRTAKGAKKPAGK